jgi:uncharacterized protein (TIGR02996 family)
MRLQVLAAAAQSLLQGDEEAALELLVGCWGDWRAAELAEVIEQLTERLSSKVPPVSGVGSLSERQAGLAAAAQRRSAMLPRLFAALPNGYGRNAPEWLAALSKWPPSPVIASQLARWLEHPPFRTKARGRCFPPMLEVLEVQRDPRTLPVLRRLAAKERRLDTIGKLGLGSWKVLQGLVQRAAEWAPAPTPTALEQALIDRLRERLIPPKAPPPSVTLEALYAAVYEQPDDDTARLILADVLQEAGDPRGELIALQLGRAAAGGKPSKRERQLLGAWLPDWLGPLEPALMKAGIVFERGFLAACAYNGVPLPQLSSWPQWTTVTHLDVAHSTVWAQGTAGLLLSPGLKSLRHLAGVGNPLDVRAIAETTRALDWESLSLKLWSLEADGRRLLANAPLPSLTRLGLLGVSPAPLTGLDEGALARIFEGPLGRTLHHVALAMRPPLFGMLIDFAGTQRLTSLALHPTSRTLGLSFDVATRSVVIHFDPADDDSMEAIVSAMKSVRRGTVDRVLLNLKRSAADVSLRDLKKAIGEAELVLPVRGP